MTMNQNELLSALVDGELHGDELEQVLTLLATDRLAAAQFQRYQQTQDILKGYAERGLSTQLTERISRLIEDEPAYTQQARPHKARVINLPTPLWKQITGLAVAASVGAMAVVGVMTQPEQELLPVSPMASVESPPGQVMTVAQTGERWTVDEPEIESRLNNYLLDHNEQTGSSGVFSYARVVSYGTE